MNVRAELQTAQLELNMRWCTSILATEMMMLMLVECTRWTLERHPHKTLATKISIYTCVCMCSCGAFTAVARRLASARQRISIYTTKFRPYERCWTVDAKQILISHKTISICISISRTEQWMLAALEAALYAAHAFDFGWLYLGCDTTNDWLWTILLYIYSGFP